MVAFPTSVPAEVVPGRAALEVQSVQGLSAVTSLFATSPMKLLTPVARGPSVWAYTSSFGGGLVAGDQTQLEIRLGAKARCFLGTQASTKIYRNPSGKPCSHTTRATIGPGAFLAFVPDPIQAFAEARYQQEQTFHLSSDASLVMVDWLTAGRAARGERWAFGRFLSRNEIKIENARVLTDALLLDPAEGGLSGPFQLGRFNCLALLVLLGPAVREAASECLAHVQAQSVQRRATLVFSASPLRDGALVRVAGENVEAVGRELRRCLGRIGEWLGDDPLERKW
jgi:urease accessory protein